MIYLRQKAIMEVGETLQRIEERLAKGGSPDDMRNAIGEALSVIRRYLNNEPAHAAYMKAARNSKSPDAQATRLEIIQEAFKKTRSPSVIASMTGLNMRTVQTTLKRIPKK